jgi:large subunit ribosomal protein L22
MEVRAIAKYVKVQPRKVRIIADEVRGKSAVYVAHLLRFHTSKGAHELRKVLVSAIANAVENNGADADALKIATITIDEGPRQKRIQARAMGRANRILKKTSHITVVVEDVEAEAAVKAHGTKAKPRPTFVTAKPKKKAAAKAAEESPVEEAVAAPVAEEAPQVEESPVIETVTDEAPTTEEPATEEVSAEAEPAAEEGQDN